MVIEFEYQRLLKTTFFSRKGEATNSHFSTFCQSRVSSNKARQLLDILCIDGPRGKKTVMVKNKDSGREKSMPTRDFGGK